MKPFPKQYYQEKIIKTEQNYNRISNYMKGKLEKKGKIRDIHDQRNFYTLVLCIGRMPSLKTQ